MQSRMRDLVNMVKESGLEVVDRPYRESSNYCVKASAPNGHERIFRVRTGGGLTDDVDMQTRIRRFARENPAPAREPEAQAEPPPQPQPKPASKPIITPKQPTRKILKVNAGKPATTTENTTAAAPVSAALEQLTTAELFRLGKWAAAVDLSTIPSLEAMAVAASSHIGHTVSEQVMREVMEASETPEPEHWTALPEPHVIVARELATFMAELNVKPSRNFARLMEVLA